MELRLVGHGKMGKEVATLANERGHTPKDDARVIIDFSTAAAVLENLPTFAKEGKVHIIGTTGWESALDEMKACVLAHGSTALYAPNFSVGMALFTKLVDQAHQLLVDYTATGHEVHHTEKKDAPSGTAKRLSEIFGIPFTSERKGTVKGIHSVSYDNAIDTITLTHTAKNRRGFALGALLAAEWAEHKKGWLEFDDFIRSIYRTHHTVL